MSPSPTSHEDFREPTDADLHRFPKLPEGVNRPEGEAVADVRRVNSWSVRGWIRAAWWGDGSHGTPYNVGVQYIPADGPDRAPTLEEMHAAVTAVAKPGAVFNVPALAAGLPFMDPDREPGHPPMFILIQVAAAPGSPAARRLALTAPHGGPDDGREGSPGIIPGR